MPGDDPALYKTVPHHKFPGDLMLDHKPNGDCIYLGKVGCTIYDKRPRMCREFDCRNFFPDLKIDEVRALEARGIIRLAVWRQGKRLRTKTTKTL